MSVRAKPTIIGLFVSIAIMLAVAAVLLFGSGKLFNHQEKFIIYFTDSVNGLQPGSAVKFKGVQIGQVSSILINFDQPPDNNAIPVIIQIDTTHLRQDLGLKLNLSDPETFQHVIDGGLRARLQMQSFVTNQLYIELDDIVGAAPAKPVGLSGEYKEIPSIPSGLSEVIQSVTTALTNLSKVDFVDMADRINHLTDELTKGVNDLNLKQLNDSLIAAANNLNALLADPKIKEAVDKLGSTLDDLDHLAVSLNSQVQPLSDEIQATTRSARATLDELNRTLTAVRDLVGPDSPLHTELDRALNEITAAARAVHVLSDFLEANPTSLLTGKAPPGGPLYSPEVAVPAKSAAPAPAPAADTSTNLLPGGGSRR